MAGEWIETTLGEVTDFLSGGTPSKDRPDYWGGSIPWVSAKDMKRFRLEDTEDHVSEDGVANGTRLVPAGSVLVLARGMTLLNDLPICVISRPMTFNQDVKALRPKPHILREYLPYLLLGNKDRLLSLVDLAGHGTGRLNSDELKALDVALPSQSEQRAIARILGALDDKIELNRRMNETLEAIARALFKSWFVDFEPVRAKATGRDSGLPQPVTDLFPDSFEDSDLGEIPKGWNAGPLERVLSELEVGSRPKGGVSSYSEGVPSIGAESIVGLGRFDYSKTKFIPRSFFDSMKKGHVKNRDVLLYKDGGRPGEYEPHVTLVGDGFPFATCAINEHVYRLRAKSTLGQNYLVFWLSSDLVMEEMRIKGTGVAIPGLNSTQVKSLRTLIPSPGVIGAFDDISDRLIASVLSTCNESRTLATLRDVLLPRLVSGALRVNDARKFIERVA